VLFAIEDLAVVVVVIIVVLIYPGIAVIIASVVMMSTMVFMIPMPRLQVPAIGIVLIMG
jgi:capsule polysaccharide export protein KpsE/RkpR